MFLQYLFMEDQYLPGNYKGKDVTIVDVFEGVGKHSTGKMSKRRFA